MKRTIKFVTLAGVVILAATTSGCLGRARVVPQDTSTADVQTPAGSDGAATGVDSQTYTGSDGASTSAPGTPDASATTGVPDIHNANNSLDYDGVYVGAVCGATDDSKTEIRLDRAGNYVRINDYVTTRESVSGTFTWNEAGNTITLSGDISPRRYFVAENRLIPIDDNGQRETDPEYFLNKTME